MAMSELQLWEAEYVDQKKCEANLGYIVSLRSPWAMYIGGICPKTPSLKKRILQIIYIPKHISKIFFASSFQTFILLLS